MHGTWLVPIYDDEQRLIETQGIGAFNALVEDAEISVVDPLRDSYLRLGPH